ncbi:unnamed protein product [Vitrella brassicaformis CCMP3155]|uniref:Uncharacterized protein n=1 Tax=Vitrella brassicaformis (strain CCMP3155) TaxID=1169540 RepID=A0A0G4EQ74_VITBC|nr:unnamed protein product [Vitrella brassicaformis CCMP3155]|eukprot:CEL99562.1 unnamed protein product [Vitrella brassicaformis CCMP3155]
MTLPDGGSDKEIARLLREKLRTEREVWAKKEAMFEQELLRVCRENSEINKELRAAKQDNNQLLTKPAVKAVSSDAPSTSSTASTASAIEELIRLLKDKLRTEREEWAKKE